MIYPTKPTNFISKFDIVGCFCMRDNTLLLLHRQDHKPQGDLWGMPAGKVGADETLVQAMHRELKEESGLDVPVAELQYVQKVYTRFPEFDFTFHIYKAKIRSTAEIIVNPKEHKAFLWANPDKLDGLNLMEDVEEYIKLYYDHSY